MNYFLRWLTASSYFERLIYYLFITELIVRIVFEYGLGQWWFVLSGTRLLIFYGIVSLDIMVWLLRGRLNICAKDPINILSISLLTIIMLHGLLLGVLSGNRLERILIDTIPFVLILISLMRFNSIKSLEYDQVFSRVIKYTLITIFILIVFGYAGTAKGLPMKVAPPSSIIAIAIACYGSQIAFESKYSSLFGVSVVFWIFILLSLDDINRSTMAVAGLTFATAAILRLRFDRLGGSLALLCIIIAPFALYAVLPEGSKTQVRIQAMLNSDNKSNSVSLNSRIYEKNQVTLKLKQEGIEAELMGLGHGGVYEYFIYGDYKPGHGHAHYGSALFNLRYGKIGQLYIYILGGVLLTLFAISVFRSKSRIALMAGFLCAASFVYLFTYAAFFLYLFGIPLLIAIPSVRSWVGKEMRPRAI